MKFKKGLHEIRQFVYLTALTGPATTGLRFSPWLKQRNNSFTFKHQRVVMQKTFSEHLDESIKLELNLARLYTVFHDLFPDDEDLWWQLAIEERSHAALLQQEKKQPQPLEFFPENLLADDLKVLVDANARITGLINRFTETAPSRQDALNHALQLELSAGEAHFQEFMDSETSSISADIFKQLANEDKDHALRIKEYMKSNGVRELRVM
jgi:ferritin